MNKKHTHLDITLFLVPVILIIFLIIAAYFLHINIEKERDAIEKEAEYKELSFSLSKSSDYLTTEVRNFAVKMNPANLRNYWDEIKTKKTRDKVISRLKDLETPVNEFKLLNQAKNNSDDLVNTEIRAMKLILSVYEVPADQMQSELAEYQLTEEEEKMTVNQKINLAREILYDENYEMNKRKIRNPISEFDTVMTTRIRNETSVARYNTNLAKIVLFAAIALLGLYILYTAWFLLYRIIVPLKKYLSDSEEHEKDADNNTKSQKAFDFIKNLENLITKDAK